MANKAAVLGLGFASVLAGPTIDSILDNVNSRLESNVSSLYAQTQKQVKYTELTDANYKKEVLDCKRPVIVMFYDSNCERAPPSCRMLKVMDALIQQYKDQIKFCLYDGDQHKNLTKEEIKNKMKDNYGIDLYPTTIMYKDSKEIDRCRGGPASDEVVTKFTKDFDEYWVKINLINPRSDYTYKFLNTFKFNKVTK